MSLTINVLRKLSGISNSADELSAQEKAMLKPADGIGFRSVKIIQDVQVLVRNIDDEKREFFIIVNEEILKSLKKRSTYKADLWGTKTEDGDLAMHIVSKVSKRSWVNSFRESLIKAVTLTCCITRDRDAEIYKTMVNDVVDVSDITEEQIGELVEDGFGDYMISDLNHPALKGLVRGSVDTVDDVDESTSKSVLDDELAELNKAVENISIGADEKAVNEAVGKVDVIDVNVDEDITMPSDESKSFDSNGSHDLDLDIDLDLEAGFDEDLSELGDLDPEAEEKKALRELENLDLSID